MIYHREIERALKWFFLTQNRENFGWSWTPNISPNAQNTAEVVYACCLFSSVLSDNQKLLIQEAVHYWLLRPGLHAVLAVDWIWIGMALSLYMERHDDFSSSPVCLPVERIQKSISECIQHILSLQNNDGGWGDNKGDQSTVFRTALAIYFLGKQSDDSSAELKHALERAVQWICALQNDDGGFGVIEETGISEDTRQAYASMGIDHRVIEEQILSSMSATGYALIALSAISPYSRYGRISKAIAYLEATAAQQGYKIFYEVGVRKDSPFTFRHFGAAWMGIGLLDSGQRDFMSPSVLGILKYMLQLEDRAGGGFRVSDASEVYTWSNCNALIFLFRPQESLHRIDGRDYTDIIVDYYMEKKSMYAKIRRWLREVRQSAHAIFGEGRKTPGRGV